MKDYKSVTQFRSGDLVYLDDSKNCLGIYQSSDFSKVDQKALLDKANYV